MKIEFDTENYLVLTARGSREKEVLTKVERLLTSMNKQYGSLSHNNAVIRITLPLTKRRKT